MKYKDLNNITFSENFTEATDPDGMGSLMEGLFDYEREKSLQVIANHKALTALHTLEATPVFEVFGCPVCGEVYFDKDNADHCADNERLLLVRFAGAKVGDWVKYEVKLTETLDCWSDLNPGDIFYKQITGFSHCYSGFCCGRILSIHAGGDSIIADSMARWSLTTESEYKLHVKEKKQKELQKLQDDLNEE